MDQINQASTHDALTRTRLQLHGIAECLLAGPEHRATGEIALAVRPGGFATTAKPRLALSGLEIVSDERRVPAEGTFANLADALGVEFGAPTLGYADGSGAEPDDVIDLDPAATRLIEDWFALSDAALRVLDPDQTPVLWPEHFDVAIELDDHTFGSSPGDDHHPTPYAYLSTRGSDGSDFFNAPFGALRDHTQITGVDDLVAFWREGRDRLGAARSGKVLWHLTMSLDGFIAGPHHEMGWMAGFDFTPGLVERYVAGTGAILAGRRGFDAGQRDDLDRDAAPYGGAWSGPIFVLTHHLEDAAPQDGITFLNCDIAEAVRIGLEAAGGKDLEVFGSDLARQCLERGLIDEFHVHLAPVMLGDGIRLLDAPGIDPVRWERIVEADSGAQVLDLRYRGV